jgi:hypothetical protein
VLGELALDDKEFMALAVESGDDAELAREIKAKLGR